MVQYYIGMSEIRDKVFSLLDDCSKTLVFTSEIVAAKWLQEYVRARKGKAVFRSSAVSWDQFKLGLIDAGPRRRASKTDIIVFANGLLENESVFSKLKFFSNKNYPEAKRAFSKTIADYVSFFPYACEKGVLETFPEEISNDIKRIESAYRTYLEENGLYDFTYEQKDYSALTEDVVLVFPETFCDELVPEIMASGKCSVLKLEESFSTPLHEYRNSLSEIKAVFRKIQQLLESGVPFGDIAISTPCADCYRPYMEAEAKARGIRLSDTSAKKLELSGPGMLLKAIERVVREDYSFDSLADLLLNPAFPFRDRSLCRKIIDIGVEYKVLDGDRTRWERELEFAESDISYNEKLKFPKAKDARILFGRIADGIEKIVNGENAEAIQKAYSDFCSDFFVEKLFVPSSRDYSAILRILDEIGHAPSVNNKPFTLLMDIVENKSIAGTDRGEGIPVYSYPISAGLTVKHHFVLGLSDGNTEMVLDKYPYLDDLDECKKTASASISGELINAYASTGLSENVWLSGTKNGFEGSRLLPVRLNSVFVSPETENDSYNAEKVIWTGLKTKGKALPVQKAQFEEAKKNVLSYTGETKFPKKALSGKEVSATYFKDFGQCNYLGFLDIFLSAKDKRLEPVMYDSFVTGNILHKCIQNSLEEKKYFKNIDKATLDSNLKKAIDEQRKEHLIGSAAQADHIFGIYSEVLPKIIDAAKEAEIDEIKLFANEHTFSSPFYIETLDKVTLNGRVDTILRNDDEFTIIDFKTNGKDDYSSYKNADNKTVCDLEKTNPQVALYGEIASRNLLNVKIVRGGYYKINDGKFCFVWQDYDYWKTVKENLETRINDFSTAVTEGKYPLTTDVNNCKNCVFSRVCRRGFSF